MDHPVDADDVGCSQSVDPREAVFATGHGESEVTSQTPVLGQLLIAYKTAVFVDTGIIAHHYAGQLESRAKKYRISTHTHIGLHTRTPSRIHSALPAVLRENLYRLVVNAGRSRRREKVSGVEETSKTGRQEE